jgi:hypothetical protein
MDKDQTIYAEAQIAATLSVALAHGQGGVMTPKQVIVSYAEMVRYIRERGIDLINPTDK